VEQSDRQTAADGDNHDSPGVAFHEAMAQIGELRGYVSHYLSARLDALKLTVRHAVLWIALAALAMLASLAVVVTAIVILCVGLAQMISAALGGRMWAGNLIVGVVLIGGIVLCIWLGVRKLFAASLSRTVERYERKLRRQRVELGHDAQQRAAEHDAD
jgi:hypothetical protein